jgi:RecB family exonuclease
LADLIDGRGERVEAADARRAVLDDELRSFAMACSRASSRLVVTAVSSPEQRPSEFFSLLGVDLPRDEDGRPIVTKASLPLDLRGLVARLRGAVVAQEAAHQGDQAGSRSDADQNPDSEDVRLLAALATEGIAGADPAWWPGLVPDSTDRPLRPAGEPVPISPSRVETLANCPLRWALEGVGGRGEAGISQHLGTILHSVAENCRSTDPEELAAAFEAEWQALGLAETWENRRERALGLGMTKALAAYNTTHGEALAVEAEFDIVLGESGEGGAVRLRGKVDRVEPAAREPANNTENGPEKGSDTTGESEHLAVRIVDFKTGASPVTKDQAEHNPQLGVYQAAVEAGGLRDILGPGAIPQGAALVFLAATRAGGQPIERTQAARGEGEDWVRPLLARCAEAASSPRFEARPGDHCRHCKLASSCPANELGKGVTA